MSYSRRPTCPACGGDFPQTASCSRVNPVGQCQLAARDITHQHHRCAEFGCRQWWVEFLEPDAGITQSSLVCRCGARLTDGSAIGHLSMQTVCIPCSRIEGAEYLRRRAGHPGSQSEVA